jgi:hypothetical protein
MPSRLKHSFARARPNPEYVLLFGAIVFPLQQADSYVRRFRSAAALLFVGGNHLHQHKATTVAFVTSEVV